MPQNPQDAELRSKVLSNIRFVSTALFTTMLLSLIVRMYMPRVLGVERLGTYYFAESYATFFITFMSLGIESYVVRTIPKNTAAASEFFFTATIFEFLVAGLLIAAMAISLHVTGYAIETTELAVILGTYVAVVQYQSTVVRGTLLAMDQYRIVSNVEIATKVIQVGLVMGALAWSADLKLIAACFLGAEVIELMILAPYARRLSLLAPRFRLDVLKKVLVIGLPFFVAGVFSQINASVDAVLLEKLSSTTEVGYYGAAVRLKGVLLLMVPLIANALMPVLSRTLHENEAAYVKLSRAAIHTILGLGFVPTLILLVLTDRVAVFLYGAEFAPAARVLTVMGPLTLLTYLSVMLWGQISLSTDGKRLTFVTVTMLLLNATLNLAIVPVFARIWPVSGPATGAAVATLFAESVTVAMLFRLLPHKIVDRRTVKTFIFVGVPTVLVVALHDWIIDIPALWRLVGLAALLPPYCLGTGLVRISEIKGFVAMVRSSRGQQ
jgi:O-antigen/teichoic acid export membrane protein